MFSKINANKHFRENKGVTLLALCVTIIVLLILASITITALTGENSVIEKANDAKLRNKIASIKEIRDVWQTRIMDDGYTKTYQDIADELEIKKELTPDEAEELRNNGFVTIGDEQIIFSQECNLFKLTVNTGVDGTVYLPFDANAYSVTVDWGDGTKDNKGSHVYLDKNTDKHVTIDGTIDVIDSAFIPVCDTKGNIIENVSNFRYNENNNNANSNNSKLPQLVTLDNVNNNVNNNGVVNYLNEIPKYSINKLEAVNLETTYKYYRKIYSIDSWGDTGAREIYFTNCYSLSLIVKPNKNSFKNLVKLGEIKYANDDLFSEVLYFKSMFAGSNITKIPEGFFDYAPNLEDASLAFVSTKITSIPEGLFDNCKKIKFFIGTFAYCSELKNIPDGLFDYNINVKDFSFIFYETDISAIPKGLFDNCNKVNSFIGSFASCGKIKGEVPRLWDRCSNKDTYDSKDPDGLNCFADCDFSKITNGNDIPDYWFNIVLE